MEHAKHTPGPWVQGDDIRQIKSGNGIIVCNVSGAVSNPSVLSDSHLIAAAPDLLAILSAIIYLNPQLPMGYIEEAEAAIAKATGA